MARVPCAFGSPHAAHIFGMANLKNLRFVCWTAGMYWSALNAYGNSTARPCTGPSTSSCTSSLLFARRYAMQVPHWVGRDLGSTGLSNPRYATAHHRLDKALAA